MKKTKLKKGDVVVFEYRGEMRIGYKDSFSISYIPYEYKYPFLTYCDVDFCSHVTKIGTMPKEWIENEN